MGVNTAPPDHLAGLREGRGGRGRGNLELPILCEILNATGYLPVYIAQGEHLLVSEPNDDCI